MTGHARLDRAVLAELPLGCSLVSAVTLDLGPRHDAVKIVVRLQHGGMAEFFEKRVSGNIGAAMMKGKFEADNALYEALPNRVPKPVAWGTYVSNPDTHFYMAEYVEMDDGAPRPQEWAATVLELHLASMGKSPGGQFGFHVTTHLADVPVNNSWTSSWEALWAQQMKSLFDREENLNGPDETLAELRTAYFDKAIPKFLRPLESDGRSITPCLIHSDLWLGNIKKRVSTGELCLFDSCAYWGHNEADLAICYNKRYNLGSPCLEEYKRQAREVNHHASFVKDLAVEFEERNALYAIKFHVLLSIMYMGRDEGYFRKVLVDELRMIIKNIEVDSGIPSPNPSHPLGQI